MAIDMWDIKYRPSSIDDFIFTNDEQQKLITSFITKGSIPHLLLSGGSGTGKTSLVYLLKNILNIDDVDFLTINGSSNTGIDNIRDVVESFVSTFSFGKFKIVFIDEADRLSINAQESLKAITENSYETARFILACNRPGRIVSELKSRFTEIEFKNLNKDQLRFRIAKILKTEKIKLTSVELLDEYIDVLYPDFRKMLIILQANSTGGTLTKLSTVSENIENFLKLTEFIEHDDWNAARSFISKYFNADTWEDGYRFLYEYLSDIGKFSEIGIWKAGIVIINDHLYRHRSMVADADINFIACLIRLSLL